MTQEDIFRLESIFSDLDQQFIDGSSPLMIFASISDDDLEFLRSHMRLIAWGFDSDQYWARLLLTYIIIDYVYENYNQDREENANLWPLIRKYLDTYIVLSREEIIKIIYSVFEKYHLPQEKSGNLHQNTVLLNSSSRFYSNRFFDFILGQYDRKLGGEVEYDLRDVALSISKRFVEDPVKVNQMSHSYGLMIKNKNIFPDVFERVIKKIDQRMNDSLEYDLGRWEPAFDEWYSDINSSKYTRKGAEVLLRNVDGEYYLKITFPKNRGVPLKGYSIRFSMNGMSETLAISVANRSGIGESRKKHLDYPIQAVDIFGRISALDSTNVRLLDLEPSDYRFFSSSGRLVASPSAGLYNVLIKYGVKHDLEDIFSDRISNDIVLVQTRLEKGKEYHIGSDTIVSEATISKNSLSIDCPVVRTGFVISADRPFVLSKHPFISIDEGVDDIRISLKDFAGRYVFNEHVVPDSEGIDINDLVSVSSGVFSLTISYGKYRLASVRYLLVEGIDYNPDSSVSTPKDGILRIHAQGRSFKLPYTSEDMYVYTDFEVNGKKFPCGFRTPNVFFNPCPDIDENRWIKAGSEDFNTTELSSSIGVSLGCVPDGRIATLFIRSPLGTIQIPSEIQDGMCFFGIFDYISKIQSMKYHFGLEVQFGGHFYPLFNVGTKGKYDVDVCNNIALITAYYLPAGCYARYEYHSFKENLAGYLQLNRSEIFDLSVPCQLVITETNTDTNDEILIYEKKSKLINKPNLNSTLRDMDPYKRALFLLNGNGCDRDPYEAIDILESLAQQNHHQALYKLGIIYLDGQLVNVDFAKAADYFERCISYYCHPDKNTSLD